MNESAGFQRICLCLPRRKGNFICLKVIPYFFGDSLRNTALQRGKGEVLYRARK